MGGREVVQVVSRIYPFIFFPCKQIQRPYKCKKDQSSKWKIFLKSTILDVAFSFVAAALLITAGGGKDDDALLV